MRPSSANTWLTILRIYAGFFWLLKGYGKLTSPEWAAPNGQMVQIVQNMIANTSGPYHDFVVNTVLTHVSLFAALVAWGELLVGVSLVLGLLTIVGGIGGAFLALNYFVAKGAFTTAQDWATFDILTAVVSLACTMPGAARTFALDAWLFRRRRSKLVRT